MNPSSIESTLDAVLDRIDRALGVRLARVLLPCIASSAIGCLVVVLEPSVLKRPRHSYLIFNLVLAWMPISFAWLCYRRVQAGAGRSLWAFGFALAWLLFLPNSPYLFTDLIHLNSRSQPVYYWHDLLKTLLFALTGICVGMVSMQLMHGLVTRAFGWKAGWSFVALTSVVCSLGVCLGRFKRWHSWDAIHKPMQVMLDVWRFIKDPTAPNQPGGFFLMMVIFMFCSYLIFYALRHAPRTEPDPGEGGETP